MFKLYTLIVHYITNYLLFLKQMLFLLFPKTQKLKNCLDNLIIIIITIFSLYSSWNDQKYVTCKFSSIFNDLEICKFNTNIPPSKKKKRIKMLARCD